LHERAVPVTEPLTDRLFEGDGWTATVWGYYFQPTDRHPTPADLGGLLSTLHQAGTPAIELPEFTPLRSLRTTLNRTSTLPDHIVEGLHGRIDALLDSSSDLHFTLGRGLIHGDAWLATYSSTVIGRCLGTGMNARRGLASWTWPTSGR